MWSSGSKNICPMILVVFALATALTSAQTFVCMEAGDPSAAPICNSTELQSLLPTKICAYNPVYRDWTYFCTQLAYDAWINICPKKNTNVRDFCGAGGGYPDNLSCLLQSCTTDADCPQVTPFSPNPLPPCYDCCQICHEDDYCNNLVLQGVYAAPGNTSCLSCATTTPETPVASTPISAPVTTSQSRLRFANAQMNDYVTLGLAVSSFGPVPGLEALSSTGSDLPMTEYFSLPLPGIQLNQPTSVFLVDLFSGEGLTVPRNVTLEDNQSYTFIGVGPTDNSTNNVTMPYMLFGVAEKPTNPSLYAGQALVKVVNVVASSYGSRISLAISEGISIVYTQVSFGASTFFLPFQNQVDINAYLDGETLLIRNLTVTPDATTVVYLSGDLEPGYRWTSTVVPFSSISPPVQSPVSAPVSEPSCVGGFVESTGYCNCYSGFMNDFADPRYECSVPPPYDCQPLNQTTPMENYVVPSIYNLHASRNKLSLNIYSSFIANRRTLIEFPDPECNLINSPDFYTKTISGCYDEFIVNVPFATCGFTKSSQIDQDIYRGEMHVKHIDLIEIDGNTVERVVDTPFNIVIRLPKVIAVESSVEIIAAPVFSVPIKAAFVGQTVNVASQTGQLEFVTSVPAPLIVVDAQISELPYGVNASIRIVGSNCSETGYCLQHLVVDLDIHACYISGVYRMVVAIGCSTQQNCPAELQNSPVNTFLTATIVAQPTCGEAYVDIGLQGWLQAYNDPTFTSQALSFDLGEPAYFLINAYSDEVDISSVTLNAIYYYGPNVPGQFLLTNDSVTYLGAVNNFTWGHQSSSQAWFSIDVTVSAPDSNEDTLFKLNKGETGVYNFVAIVEVEWTPESATPNALPTPVSSNSPNPFKKRMALQGTLSRQGSQFTSQIQIDGTKTQNEDAVSGGSVICGSILVLVVVLISLILH